MRKFILSFCFLGFFIWSCQDNMDNSPKPENAHSATTQAIDTTPRVTGIGGIFLMADSPDSTTSWYAENLGIAMDQYGAVFETRNARDSTQKNYLRWSLSNPNDYFEPSNKGFVINYRVQHIEALVEKLERNGAVVLDSIVEYPYGKFVHILDPENNKIELWEPVDSVLSALGSPTNK
ncbi:hypothetical protein SAMN04490243_2491 [Robiginitalea myxolifaciens]|uniref:VOC domain-containing protein n=1 Tax=Robiginitalea myxolifaciens TaxID=400055 RepID=A0A1I6HB98_9FLAO|nr:VOC family protein [Robiginitalea myxolifaciens]SFR51547.1 hypothetical protein SAMN04490243_2491 [Robiginitalea myxolifaciens]